jgi:pectinesterase inhibitor-like protein
MRYVLYIESRKWHFHSSVSSESIVVTQSLLYQLPSLVALNFCTLQLLVRKMAYSFDMSVMLLSLLLVTSLSSTLISANLVDDVCKKTINPSLCKSSLKSDAHDLTALGHAGIELVQATAETAKGIAASGDSEIFKTCEKNYDEVLNRINEAKKALKSRDFGGLNIIVSAAITDVQTCDDSFAEAKVQQTPALNQANEKIKAVGSALLVISNKL